MIEVYGQFKKDMKLADLHMHTSGSDGAVTPRQMVDFAMMSGLSLVAVTDHEIIDPALDAKDYCLQKGYPLEVVVGAEITTSSGHLVVLDVKKNIPGGKSLAWTIREAHQQGGLVIAAHPMYTWTRSIKEVNLIELINSGDSDIYLDGFEVFNAGVSDNPFTKANQRALDFYQANVNLGAPVGASDAHFYTNGRGLTAFSSDFREALTASKTVVLDADFDEQIRLLDIARNLYGAIVMEPTRRIQRYARRRFNQELK